MLYTEFTKGPSFSQLVLMDAGGLQWENFSSVQFSHSVVSDTLRPHELQHTRPPCPSPTPGVYPNSCPLSRWCHPTISSSVIPSPPALNLSQHQGLFKWVSSSHQVAKDIWANWDYPFSEKYRASWDCVHIEVRKAEITLYRKMMREVIEMKKCMCWASQKLVQVFL